MNLNNQIYTPGILASFLVVFFAIFFLIAKFSPTLLKRFHSRLANLKDLLITLALGASVILTSSASFLGNMLNLDENKAAAIVSTMPTDYARARTGEFLDRENFKSSFWLISSLPALGGMLSFYAFWHYRQRARGLEAALTRAREKLSSAPRVDIEYLFDIELRHMLLSLGLTGVARATLFRDEGVQGKFSCFARHCEDEDYRERREYLYNRVGLLSKAYKNNEPDVHSNLPDPITDIDLYCDYHASNLGLARDKAKQMRMKSRSYMAVGIKDARDRNKIAVLIIESLDSNALDKKIAKKLIDMGYNKKLSYLLDAVEVFKPKLSVMKGADI